MNVQFGALDATLSPKPYWDSGCRISRVRHGIGFKDVGFQACLWHMGLEAGQLWWEGMVSKAVLRGWWS